MTKKINTELQENIFETLEILCHRTGRTKDDFINEALTQLFHEYKEIIFDTEEKMVSIEFGPGSKGLEG